MNYEKAIIKFDDNTIKFGLYTKWGQYCFPRLYNTEKEMLDNIEKAEEEFDFDEIRENSTCIHDLSRVIIYSESDGASYWTGLACPKCNLLLEEYREDLCKGKPYWIGDLENDEKSELNLNCYKVTRTDTLDYGEDIEMIVTAQNEIEARDIAIENSENFHPNNTKVELIDLKKRSVISVRRS